MNYPESLEKLLTTATDSLWRTVKPMPADKIDWHPEESARTAHELLGELVMTTLFMVDLVKTQKMPEMSSEDFGAKSVEELEKLHREGIAAYAVAIKNFPEDKLQEMIELPWAKQSFFDVMSYPYWNLVYHWGQISYIQTLYGDSTMY